MGTVYFGIDDTGLHWQGVLSTGAENDPITQEIDGKTYVIDYSHEDKDVEAQYAYLTGVASWSALIPREHRK